MIKPAVFRPAQPETRSASRAAAAGVLSPGLAAALCVGAAQAAQAAPAVATDIPPVHSLVAQVMDGIGNPALIIAGGASPHGFALRPSEARALQEAELVVWIGPDLTPSLGRALPNLSGDAAVLTLAEAPGTVTLAARETAAFALVPPAGGDDPDHAGHDGHGGHDGHAGRDGHDGHEGHDGHNHDAHNHADHAEKDDRAEADGQAHAHDHGGTDPHFWLDPANAVVWLPLIAQELSRIDPANAAAYDANAAAAVARLAAQRAEIDATLAPVRGRGYIVFHDGYQYFERSFAMPAAGAIALSDASDPSPARIAEIRDVVQSGGIRCVFSEPQLNTALVGPVFEGMEVQIAVADLLGATLEPGPALYGQLLGDLAGALAACLD